jgi:ankyrin repeat protein
VNHYTALCDTARSEYGSAVRLLLEHKVDIGAKGRSNETPLSLAAKNNQTAIVRLLLGQELVEQREMRKLYLESRNWDMKQS